ncbi:hypothetical protein [Cellulosimicrobium sp. Marseille-Q8652]
MPDNALTHLAMLLDRSGSMQAIKTATEQGFDLFLSEQREAPGRCTVTLAQFDNEYEEVYTDLDIRQVPRLDLRPRGMTALLDSIGRLVQTTALRIAQLPEEQRPGAVIVGIMTDGMENASKEFTHAAIKALVTEREETFGWTFLYMGANQDAIEVGESIGVKRERSLTYDTANVDQAYAATSRSMAAMRGAVWAGAAPAAARDQHAGYTEAERLSAAAPRGAARRGGEGTKTSPFSELELLAHLRSWLTTGETTVADVTSYGGSAALHAVLGGVPVFINADSSRAAVQELIDDAARGPVRWSALANRSGTLNKVTFRPDGASVPGFYCYTSEVQRTAGPLGAVANRR